MTTSACHESVESRASWVAATITLVILSISYGAPLIVVVGLKPIAASLGADRSVVALAASLIWLGTGLGGIVMGRMADRVGMRSVAIFGATNDAATGPTGLLARVVREPVECSPCLKRECPIDHRCMTRVDAARVAETALELVK